ncbi:MAG TPA: alpha/beta fold hydrolase, partial [Rubrobacteraceae bacterium]|nr:alpha/beta fold hydrolase [Rubrobacteraceae bacterium]
SVRPLGEALAAEGFTVAGPRLKGHGTSMEDHARSTARDWISSIEEDLAWLEERTNSVFFAGLSMGGMFSLYFGGMRPDLIRGIIPINACVFLNNPDLARIVFDPKAPPSVPGVGSDIKAPGVVLHARSMPRQARSRHREALRGERLAQRPDALRGPREPVRDEHSDLVPLEAKRFRALHDLLLHSRTSHHSGSQFPEVL